ncbi:hypothetical protein M0R04_07060 [Candidatus Dojkabacteria bacterium]|nr:hypothetical protein [Candidatus Dojkabacteria bacterium]
MSESIYPIISRKEAKTQGLKFYFTGKPCPSGHIVEKLVSDYGCVECQRLYHRLHYKKKYQDCELSALYPIISRKEAKTQGLKFYFTGKPCPSGHIVERYTSSNCCVECQMNSRKTDKFKTYNKKYNKQYAKTDKAKEANRVYAKTDKAKTYYNKHGKEYRKTDEYKKYRSEYEANRKVIYKENENPTKHKNTEEHRERRRDYEKNRRYTDPLFKLTCSIRNNIRGAIKRGKFKKSSNTTKILGCSFEEFKIHIETQFLEGMTWENVGVWEYDHYYPVSRADDEAHLIELNHYTNFQPLWGEDNRTKGNLLPTEWEATEASEKYRFQNRTKGDKILI